MISTATTEELWASVSEKVFNNLKIKIMQDYVQDVFLHYHARLEYIVKRYARFLPAHVAQSEIDDLRTIAKLELLETIKVWDLTKSQDVWPLAQVRIIGAMKDHIRYVTKSDPSRFYDWITDAAHVYMATNDRADFEHSIETGDQLNRALKILSPREKKVVIDHTKHDLTFKQIGDGLEISESQISRIYKKAIEKIRKNVGA